LLTNKQRSYLRSLGHKLEPIFHLGKNGFDDNFFKGVNQALETRELIKIKVLNNSDYEAREASDILCKKINCEGVQAIGSVFVVYKKSKDKPKIELPV
jgi:RNA-binding protein